MSSYLHKKRSKNSLFFFPRNFLGEKSFSYTESIFSEQNTSFPSGKFQLQFVNDQQLMETGLNFAVFSTS